MAATVRSQSAPRVSPRFGLSDQALAAKAPAASSGPQAPVRQLTAPQPGKPLPEAVPAKAQPAEAQPADASPAKARPAEASPARAPPAKAPPAQAGPAEASPARAPPAQAQPAAAPPAKATAEASQREWGPNPRWTDWSSGREGEWVHQGFAPSVLRNTQLCKFYFAKEGNFCRRPNTCTFSHSVDGLRIPPPPLAKARTDYPRMYFTGA